MFHKIIHKFSSNIFYKNFLPTRRGILSRSSVRGVNKKPNMPKYVRLKVFYNIIQMKPLCAERIQIIRVLHRESYSRVSRQSGLVLQTRSTLHYHSYYKAYVITDQHQWNFAKNSHQSSSKKRQD